MGAKARLSDRLVLPPCLIGGVGTGVEQIRVDPTSAHGQELGIGVLPGVEEDLVLGSRLLTPEEPEVPLALPLSPGFCAGETKVLRPRAIGKPFGRFWLVKGRAAAPILEQEER